MRNNHTAVLRTWGQLGPYLKHRAMTVPPEQTQRRTTRNISAPGILNAFGECAQSPWVLIAKSGDFSVEFDEGGGLKNRRLARRKIAIRQVLAILSRVSRCVASRHNHCTICCTGRRTALRQTVGASGHSDLANQKPLGKRVQIWTPGTILNFGSRTNRMSKRLIDSVRFGGSATPGRIYDHRTTAET
jgi:hypothetical protein